MRIVGHLIICAKKYIATFFSYFQKNAYPINFKGRRYVIIQNFEGGKIVEILHFEVFSYNAVI